MTDLEIEVSQSESISGGVWIARADYNPIDRDILFFQGTNDGRAEFPCTLAQINHLIYCLEDIKRIHGNYLSKPIRPLSVPTPQDKPNPPSPWWKFW